MSMNVSNSISFGVLCDENSQMRTEANFNKRYQEMMTQTEEQMNHPNSKDKDQAKPHQTEGSEKSISQTSNVKRNLKVDF